MSGVAIVRALLAAHAPLTALVPAVRIRAGVIPQGMELPAISVTEVGNNEMPTVARNASVKMIRERVQVTLLVKETADAAGYTLLKNALKAAALGAGVHTGQVLGYPVRSVIDQGTNPEIPVNDDRIYEQSRDFMVTFIEAN